MKFIKLKAGSRVLKIKDCRGFMSLKGLMFDPMESHDGALVHGNLIWMPFVRHDLELVFLDGNLEVIEMQHAVPLTSDPRSWRVYSCMKAKYCLETRRKFKIRIRDRIKVVGSFKQG